MSDTKLWWQSRTMWINLVAMLFALLGALGKLPDGIEQDQVVTVIMGAIALINLGLRLVTRQQIVRQEL